MSDIEADAVTNKMTSEDKAIAAIPNDPYTKLKQRSKNISKMPNSPARVTAAIAASLAWRDAVTPDKLREILISYAVKRSTITYSALGEYFLGWRSSRRKIMRDLHQVSLIEHKNERPMLASIIVHEDDGRCGMGLLVLAKILKVHVKNPLKFDKEQRDLVLPTGETHSNFVSHPEQMKLKPRARPIACNWPSQSRSSPQRRICPI